MLIKYRLMESAEGDGAGGDAVSTPRETPAQVNARLNAARLARVNSIANGADNRRARELEDTDGRQVVGRFEEGARDDSAEARERAALEEEDLAAQAIEEQRERAEEAERIEREEARRLQAEGAGEEEPDRAASEGEGDRTARPEPSADTGDERVIDGVRYYLTVVAGQERWLTLKELRSQASLASQAAETLQRAEAALASASQVTSTPKASATEVTDEDLENIILSASVGDETSVRKLVSVIKGRSQGATPQEISRLVSQQIATQREVDRAERANEDLLGNELLEPIFRQRLTEFGRARPTTKIVDAYNEVAKQLRRDFAPMLSQVPGQRPGNGNGSRPPPPASKDARKRQLVMPPRGAGRQPQRSQNEREPSVDEEIDAIARSRGQQRAHRVRRS